MPRFSQIRIIVKIIGFCAISAYAQWVKTGSFDSVRVVASGYSTDVFAGTSSGLFRSLDSGGTWVAVNNGLSNTSVRSILFASLSSILVGTDNGVFRSVDGGSSWTLFNSGIPSTSVRSLCLSESYLFAATANGVYRTPSSSPAWVKIDSNFSTQNVLSIARATINLAGTQGVVAGTQGGGVYRLNSLTSSSWTVVNTNLTNLNVSAIVNNGRVFIGTNGGGVFYNQNSNDWTWQSVFGITQPTIRSLSTFPGSDDGRIIAGTNSGVFLSDQQGSQYAPMNQGLSDSIVTALSTSYLSYIYAGTNTGVWRHKFSIGTSLKGTSKGQLQFQFKGNQMSIYLTEPSLVNVYLLDNSGKRVGTLLSEYAFTGAYIRSIPTDKWANGVYFIQVVANQISEFRKVVLIR